MNKLNSGQLETLKPGETLLVAARKVNGGKLHLEFAEIIKNGNTNVNVLSILNKSDERFSSSARRSWVTAEPTDAEEHFGVSFSPSNILNPTIDETRCRVKISETTEATEWQADNIETAAKRRGKDGDYITHEGNYIFSNTNVVLSDEEVTHTLLTPDSTTVAPEVKVEDTVDENIL